MSKDNIVDFKKHKMNKHFEYLDTLMLDCNLSEELDKSVEVRYLVLSTKEYLEQEMGEIEAYVRSKGYSIMWWTPDYQ